MPFRMNSPKVARFEHSKHLTERKRVLFPSQDMDSDDSDIGHISPLQYSSSPEHYQDFLKQHVACTSKYIICLDSSEPSEQSNNENESPELIECSQETEYLNSPITKISEQEIIPIVTPTDSPEKFQDATLIPDTPKEILKTPHDSSSNTSKLELPRLVRKSLTDITNFNSSGLKRKTDSPDEPTGSSKSVKFDHSTKISKARTALFTENIFPAKSFYPKPETSKHEVCFRNDPSNKIKQVVRKQNSVYLCNREKRKNKKNKYSGEINAGVRHGIKKPKNKPALTKNQLLRAALNVLKYSPLNDILETVTIITNSSVSTENGHDVLQEQIQKMDSILKTINSYPVPPKQSTPIKMENLDEIKPNSSFGMKRGLKRAQSPESTETINRKFFKSTHSSKATVTINTNMKLSLDHGEFSLIQNPIKVPKIKTKDLEFDLLDFSLNETINTSFTDILKSLEDDKILEPIPKISQQQNNPSQTSLTNSMLLSPTSLVCDLTSGLALDSPKSQSNDSTISIEKLSTLKKRISFPDNMDNEQKLFPIFYGKQNEPKPAVKENKHVKNIRKIWKPLSEDQTIIDAGQKRFGLTQCPDCKCMYSLGEPEDEIMHYNHHNAVGVLKYHSWKHERVVNNFAGGKVIQINPNDPKTWWKKVKDLLEVMNKEIGFVDVPFDNSNKKVFLCIMNKQIVGCLISEPKTEAFKMLPCKSDVDECSAETYPIKCGVSRLWVVVTHRKKGIATCLLNAMRSNFIYGHILSMQEIAFSAPTEQGKVFASKYTKTEQFLIYTS